VKPACQLDHAVVPVLVSVTSTVKPPAHWLWVV
jgi:hypothetical protein